jgi:nitrogen fixation/metabolism regulation signal transduction histidine kinase
MSDQNIRQPVKNFFIKKSMQLKIVAKIVFIILITALFTTVTVSLVYNSKSQNGSFYYMSNDTKQDLELKNILEVILPSVIAAQLITLLIGLGIGLFSSRKIAVPIYKFEKWVSQLKTGNLMTRIEFREKTEMEDLTNECNSLAEFYRKKFTEIDAAVSSIEQNPVIDPNTTAKLKEIRDALEGVSFK